MSLVRVKMNTAAAFQLTDAQGKPSGFSALAKGDETSMEESEAKRFVKAGYATIVTGEKARN